MKRNDVASLLNVSGRTVSRYYNQGLLTGVRLANGQINYDYESVLKFFWQDRKYDAVWLTAKDNFVSDFEYFNQKADREKYLAARQLKLDSVIVFKHDFLHDNVNYLSNIIPLINCIENNQFKVLLVDDDKIFNDERIFKIISHLLTLHHMKLMFYEI